MTNWMERKPVHWHVFLKGNSKNDKKKRLNQLKMYKENPSVIKGKHLEINNELKVEHFRN